MGGIASIPPKFNRKTFYGPAIFINVLERFVFVVTNFVFDVYVRELRRPFRFWVLRQNKVSVPNFFWFVKYYVRLLLTYWFTFKEFLDISAFLVTKVSSGQVSFWRRALNRKLFRIRLRNFWLKRRRVRRWEMRDRLRKFLYRLTNMDTYFAATYFRPGAVSSEMGHFMNGEWNVRFALVQGSSGIMLGPVPLRFFYYFFRNKFFWYSVIAQLGSWSQWQY